MIPSKHALSRSVIIASLSLVVIKHRIGWQQLLILVCPWPSSSFWHNSHSYHSVHISNLALPLWFFPLPSHIIMFLREHNASIIMQHQQQDVTNGHISSPLQVFPQPAFFTSSSFTDTSLFANRSIQFIFSICCNTSPQEFLVLQFSSLCSPIGLEFTPVKKCAPNTQLYQHIFCHMLLNIRQ